MKIWDPKLADFYKEIYAMGQRLPPWSLTERVAHWKEGANSNHYSIMKQYTSNSLSFFKLVLYYK